METAVPNCPRARRRSSIWAIATRPVILAALVALSGSPEAANLATLGQAARSARPGPFGAVEIVSEALAALPQWNRLLERVATEAAPFAVCVREQRACKGASQTVWREAIVGAQHLSDRREQIEYINAAFNRFPYRTDQTLYGVSEYWATPREFLARSGDCEDYAIIKYYALRALGFAPDELRIVVLRDRIRDIGHAILAVYMEDDILILDNLSNAVLSHNLYHHYIPQYSVNESGRWLHIVPGQRPLTD